MPLFYIRKIITEFYEVKSASKARALVKTISRPKKYKVVRIVTDVQIEQEEATDGKEN